MIVRTPYPTVPNELQDMVADVVKRRGVRGAAAVLGLSRSTVAAVLAGLPVQGGSIAVLRLAAARRPAEGHHPAVDEVPGDLQRERF